MGFSIGKGLAGAAGLGMVTGGLSTLAGFLPGGGGETRQEAMMTPEQKAAMAKLGNFAQTGTYGDFTAGAQVPLGYGDFNATGIENQGQSALQDLLKNGIPEQYRMGDEALAGFLKNDPASIKAQFDPFADQVNRQVSESNRALTRNAGFAGNLYSTDTIRKLGDVQARGNETLTAELARLTDSAAERRLRAVPLAYQSAEMQQGAKLQQISASQQYGALTRQLNDASIKARDAEILRRREELKMPIQAAQGLMGTNVNYGIPSVKNQSPYADLLGMVGQVGGTALGSYAGGYGAVAGARAGKA